MKKKTVSLISAALLFLYSAFSVYAVSYTETADNEASVARHLLNSPVPSVGSIGGEWMVIGLARSGKISKEFSDGYYSNAESYVKAVGSNKLHRSKSTENSRMIIALTSIGKDPRDIAGYNLLTPLADFNFVKKQGINGPVWALIAFDTMQYDIPTDQLVTVQTTREKLIDYILLNQCSDGGWDLNGESADADVTGMAIQALAPYVTKNTGVREAVEKALNVISNSQNSNGCFMTGGEATPESSAQIITALSAMNIDSNADERFIKSGNSALDGLLSFSVENGFEHTNGKGYNQMSTEQSYYALVSFDRYKNGQNSLYDMTDLIAKGDVNQSGSATISDATMIQKYIAKISGFSLLQQKLADINKDGKVDINDVTALQKYLVTK